eukprot:jgi/Picre1/27592/NNA_000557.t1
MGRVPCFHYENVQVAWRPSLQNLAVFPVMDHIGGMDHGKPAVKGVEQGCPKGMHFASPMDLRHVQMMEKSPWLLLQDINSATVVVEVEISPDDTQVSDVPFSSAYYAAVLPEAASQYGSKNFQVDSVLTSSTLGCVVMVYVRLGKGR